MPEHIALLVNPVAGRRRGARVGMDLARALRAAGAEVTVAAGRTAEESSQLAYDLVAKQPDALVTVGGDGLAHLALQAVVGTDVALGIMAAGTGNDLAREFGLPRDVAAAADAVRAGRTRRVDAVRAGRRYFLSVLACGFDSRVSERVNGFRFSLGRAGYLAALVAELRDFRPVPFVLDIDGEPMRADGMLVALGNTPCYGGGMRVCPDAVCDDGLLDVVLVPPVARRRFVQLFPHVYRGTHTGLDEVTVLRARRVTLETAEPTGVVAYADGEPIAPLPLTCEVEPGAVRILR